MIGDASGRLTGAAKVPWLLGLGAQVRVSLVRVPGMKKVWIVVSFVALLCGCRDKKQRAVDCGDILSLGVGEASSSPRDAAARGESIRIIGLTLDEWTTRRTRVATPSFRAAGDAMAAVLTRRRELLSKAFAGSSTLDPGVARALSENQAEYVKAFADLDAQCETAR
ncbi:MAG: hypothetical protein NVSMB47_13130 [Polyangiales bacterium]